jgi:hypothetical protein
VHVHFDHVATWGHPRSGCSEAPGRTLLANAGAAIAVLIAMIAAPIKCLFMMKAPVRRDARRFSALSRYRNISFDMLY